MSMRIGKRANTRSIAAAAGMLALALLLALAGGSPAAKQRMHIGQAKPVGPKPPPTHSLYWGAWIGKQLTGTQAPYDMSAVSTFEQMVNKPLSLIQWAVPFADCANPTCTFFNFPVNQMNDVRGYGAIPFLSWSSARIGRDPEHPNVQPEFQLDDITAGHYDSYIQNFAAQARDWGHPFFLRFNWEMNGNWFPWGRDTNGNQTEDFVPAWRHVHDIFTAVGATNATWVWCPYVEHPNSPGLGHFYPGDASVDWTCLDGYNWGPTSPANPIPWRSFGTIYRQSYRKVVTRIAPRKPMIFAEIATSDYGGDKPAWIRNMFAKVRRDYRKVFGLIWFDVNDRNAHWPLEDSQAAVDAFAAGISHPAYLTNPFSQFETSPVPVPPRLP